MGRIRRLCGAGGIRVLVVAQVQRVPQEGPRFGSGYSQSCRASLLLRQGRYSRRTVRRLGRGAERALEELESSGGLQHPHQEVHEAVPPAAHNLLQELDDDVEGCAQVHQVTLAGQPHQSVRQVGEEGGHEAEVRRVQTLGRSPQRVGPQSEVRQQQHHGEDEQRRRKVGLVLGPPEFVGAESDDAVVGEMHIQTREHGERLRPVRRRQCHYIARPGHVGRTTPQYLAKTPLLYTNKKLAFTTPVARTLLVSFYSVDKERKMQGPVIPNSDTHEGDPPPQPSAHAQASQSQTLAVTV
uniref:Uncharacterized protein n=1 Tax=Timema cristinae TaxID=61476 RepID=A0A7R9H473_TIMCR|nr:unnamed protein product [Timema cristinae]